MHASHEAKFNFNNPKLLSPRVQGLRTLNIAPARFTLKADNQGTIAFGNISYLLLTR